MTSSSSARRELTRPRAVRNALVYVLANHRKHRASAAFVDPCSSGAWFDGWRDDELTEMAFRSRALKPLCATAPPTATPREWLLTTGWKQRGLVRVDEVPVSPTPSTRRARRRDAAATARRR